MYLISLYFDEKTNRLLQRYIDKIAQQTGNTFMIDYQVPPHMTVSAVEARSAEQLRPAFEDLCGRLSQGKIRFVSIGQLLPYVMYVTPVLNEYLQELSRSVYDAIGDLLETRVSNYYRPFSWLPHVTMGKTLSKEQMAVAFGVLQEVFVPFDALVTEVGLAKVNPHADIVRTKLRKDSGTDQSLTIAKV